MKKLILSFLTIAAISNIFAQSIEVTTDTQFPAITVASLGNTTDFLGFHVRNITTHEISVRINRTENNIPVGHESYYCWEVCYGPNTNLSQAVGMAIAPGATLDVFTFHVSANNIEGCGHVVVRFENVADQSDYVERVFDYCTPNAVSISNEVDVTAVLSAPIPNPASDITTIRVDLPRYTQNTYLIVRDLTGREMRRIDINSPASNVSIPTSQLTTGLYYVSLVAEGEILATQKLVVSHQ